MGILLRVVSSVLLLIMVDQSGSIWSPRKLIHDIKEAKCSLHANAYPTNFVLCRMYGGIEKNWTYQLNSAFSPFKLNKNTCFKGNLDPNKEIVFIVHGFLHGCDKRTAQTTKAVYFEARPGIQVIQVCWSAFTHLEDQIGALAWGAYALSLASTKCVGRAVAKFIDHLHTDLGVPWENMSIVGYSLGTIVGAAAGNALPSLHTLIALDPAMGFGILGKRSAKQVIVLHTSFTFGRLLPQGTADFYANMGTQPGCNQSFFNFVVSEHCNHRRSTQLFYESLRNPLAFKSLSVDKKQVAYFSPYTRAKGVFFFSTTPGIDEKGRKIPFSFPPKSPLGKQGGGRRRMVSYRSLGDEEGLEQPFPAEKVL
uniref:Phospholipase A1 2 n=1 Tax=Lygus hesperus TaxID=30085 RepID=A0A0A9X8C5_LYGHE